MEKSFEAPKKYYPYLVTITESLEPHVRASCSTTDRVVTFNSLMDWSDTQEEQILERMKNFVSSGHFLRTPIHEFMHSVHLVNLHKLAEEKQQRMSLYMNSCIMRIFQIFNKDTGKMVLTLCTNYKKTLQTKTQLL